MGACASSGARSQITKKTIKGRDRGGKGGSIRAAAVESFRRPSSIVVMDLEGGIEEFKNAITASDVISRKPNCFLCNSESMYIGTCIPRLPDDEELRPGQIYFLLPLSLSQQPLSLPALCDLAIKASSAITR